MAAAPESLYLFCTVFSAFVFSLALVKYENQFIYHGFKKSKLHLDGLAKILPNGRLLLTNRTEHQKGHAFYPFPLKFKTSSCGSFSFSTNFVFGMYYYGHGLAFVISPTLDISQADDGPYFGLFNGSNNGLPTNHILSIELDTDQTFQFNDIDGNHVGIGVNSLISVESAAATYFSEKGGHNETVLLRNAYAVQIWIDYNGGKKLLTVTLAPVRVPKPKRPLLSKHIDLSKIFLDSMYVGFPAATEMGGDKQYILGWSFNMSGPARSLDISKRPPPILPP